MLQPAIGMYPSFTVSHTHPYTVLSITDFLGRPGSALCEPQGLVASVAAWQHFGFRFIPKPQPYVTEYIVAMSRLIYNGGGIEARGVSMS